MKTLVCLFAAAALLCGCKPNAALPDSRIAQLEAKVKTLEEKQDAQQAAADLAAEQKKYKDAIDAAIAAIDKETAALKRNRSEKDAEADLDMAEKLAVLNDNKARGQINEIEYIKQAAAIRREAAGKKFQNEQEEFAGIIQNEERKKLAVAVVVEQAEKAVADQERRLEYVKRLNAQATNLPTPP
jgi:hypothetical protein